MERAFDDEAENPFGAPRIVTVPTGYAPAVGIPLSFSGADGLDVAEEPAAPPPPAVAAYLEEKPAHPAVPELPVRAPRQERALAPASPQPTPPAATPATAPPPVATYDATSPSPHESTSGRANAPSAAPPPAEVSSLQPDSTARSTPGPATSPRTDAKTGGFTIINAPRPAAAAPKPPPPPSAPAQIDTGAVTTPSPGSFEPTIADAEGASPEPQPAAQPEPPAAQPEPPLLPSADGPRLETIPMATAAVTAAALLLAGLAAVGFWYWRRAPAQVLAPAARDFGAISLDGAPQGSALALEPAAGAAVPEAPRAPDQDAGAAVMDELPVPTTYAQALDILGASPEASVAAIKKIVDGLRQSWHPDLARSETDRAHRERRVRQINVAWDLVSQRRSAA
jgi:hypothetical protein